MFQRSWSLSTKGVGLWSSIKDLTFNDSGRKTIITLKCETSLELGSIQQTVRCVDASIRKGRRLQTYSETNQKFHYASLLQTWVLASIDNTPQLSTPSFFSNMTLSPFRDWQKLPRLTVFQVIPAGYWVKFSTSNNHASDRPHRLRYCLCERMLATLVTSPLLQSGHGTAGWYQTVNCNANSLLALMAACCVDTSSKRYAQELLCIALTLLKTKWPLLS